MDQIPNNLPELIRTKIRQAVFKAIEKAGYKTIDDFHIETPRDSRFGDFSTNAAMLLARQERQNPRVLAQNIIDNMDIDKTHIEKVGLAGAGFINFYLKHGWQTKVIPIVESMGKDYGRSDFGQGKKVMVEFVSANPTGPMHMGNARGGALGDSLANLLDMAGYNVTREFYLNDAGNQIEKFANSLEARYMQLYGDFEFPEDGYHGEDIIQRAKEFSKLYGDKYVKASSQERKDALTEFALEKNIAQIKDTLKRYRVVHDVWFRESDLYKNSEVKRIIEALKKTGKTYEKEGALWLKGKEKDEVLVRANKIPTYFAADIAYHYNKFANRGFDIVINIWGADHHGHISRMKDAMEALGIEPERLKIIIMQLVRLMKGGEVARMSKRTGEAITLTDLLDEIGVDAARFFFNMRLAGSHFDFDLDLAVEQSNDNPVFYVQYAYARICSIIRQLKQEGVTVPSCKEVDFSLLNKPEELDLLRKIADLPDEILAAAEAMEPSKMAHYAIDLASLFHTFYNAHRVITDQKPLTMARLKLIETIRITLKNVLAILAVDAPEKM